MDIVCNNANIHVWHPNFKLEELVFFPRLSYLLGLEAQEKLLGLETWVELEAYFLSPLLAPYPPLLSELPWLL